MDRRLSMSDKPFKTYDEQLQLLISRGMAVENQARALKKLRDIGYYRLSGFWYPCRKFLLDEHGNFLPSSANPKVMRREEEFLKGTSFDNVLALYLFDKKLRLLMLDALERIEIFMRVLLAHEMGKYHPCAYKDVSFINPKWTKSMPGQPSIWNRWCAKLTEQVRKSKEDCILWYHHEHADIPMWVSAQVWDFGMLSKYYSLLKGRYQNAVCHEICPALTPNILTNWLQALNILRNRCAHHGRIWNQSGMSVLFPKDIPYFQSAPLSPDGHARLAALIAVLWFFIHHLGPHSTWLDRVQGVLTSMPCLPNCSFESMGFYSPPEDTFTLWRHAL